MDRSAIGRRSLLQGAAAFGLTGVGGVFWPGQNVARAAPPIALTMPPVLDARTDHRLRLQAMAGQTRFGTGAPGRTAGFNGGYLGPTLRLGPGAIATEVVNTLDEAITVHWHGLLVPGDVDGGPHALITPGKTRRFTIPLDQPPMTAWYHSHVHGHTARHVYAGLAGMIQITDGLDDQRGLPSEYGIDDLTLILQDRRFDAEGRLVYDLTPTDILNGFHGNRMLVNGQVGRTAVVPQGIVRLRILNASNARTYTLLFPDRRDMHLIATDAGYLPQPQPIGVLRIASGERAEVLVDFSNGMPARLISGRGQMGILSFAVDTRLPARITQLPGRIAPDLPPINVPKDAVVRTFSLNTGGGAPTATALAVFPNAPPARVAEAVAAMVAAGWPEDLAREICTAPLGSAMVETGAETASGSDHQLHDFAINGRSYDPARIDLRLTRATTERWIISGGAASEHPFHVHGVHFRVLSEGGGQPRPENRGWKDTVLVSGQIEIAIRFDQTAPDLYPFMYHCHILEHEDAGMMGQFTVV